jgi:pimeloyl-ACP methyl ester carboxylesterase
MEKPLVVLVHGVGLDHTMWRPVVGLLQDEFEVLTPDLLGHGTNGPARDGVTLAELADDVAARLPRSAHLVGFSLGALVAQHLARYRPDLIVSLTSVNSVCRRTDRERTAVLGRLATAGTDFAAGVEAALQRWYDGTGVDAALVAQTRETLLANDIASYLNCYRVFATGDAEIGPELPRITTPALAITGELDPGSTPDMTRRLAAALPDCRAVVVPGARHMLPVQLPREFVAALTTFIGERSNVASRPV